MKQLKRISALGLAVLFIGTTPLNALALSSEDSARLRDNILEYDEIYNLIDTYNVSVLNGKKSLKQMEEGLDESMDDIDQQIQDLQDTINGLSEAIKDPASNPNYATAVSNLIQLQSLAKQLEKQRDKGRKSTDRQMIKIQLDQAEMQIVSAAQSLMVTYNQLLANLAGTRSSLPMAQAQHESAKTQFALGMCTNQDVTAASNAVASLNSGIESLEHNIRKVRQELGKLTGWKVDSEPEIRDIPDADLTQIDTMNLSVDIGKAIGNSYILRYKRRNLEVTDTTSDREILKNEINAEEENVRSSLSQQYNAVLEKKASYEQAMRDFDMETIKMTTIQKKYDLGMIGKLEYIAQQSSLDSKTNTLKTANMDLFWAIETYNGIIKGIPVGSTN